MRKLFCTAAALLLLIAPALHGQEVDYGYVIMDKKPLSIKWEKDGSMYALQTNFKDCKIRTYFHKRRHRNFFISLKNKPFEQAFTHTSGIICSHLCSKIEHYADGARSCCFRYNDIIYNGEKCALTVTIIDLGRKKQPEVRYTFYRLADQGED